MCLGIPGQIVEISDSDRNLAIADVSGVRREINVACVRGEGQALDDLIGSWVLIHVGFAMSLIDEHEAAETMRTLVLLGEAMEELDAMSQSEKAVGKA